jgi:two-component system chemotaxis sensor kinase CheA
VIKVQSGFQELLDEFLLEARERADEVESMLLRLKSDDPEVKDAAIARAKRELHTLKGNSGMMGFTDLQELAHHMEDQVEELDLDRPEIDGLLSDLDDLRQGLESARPEILDDGTLEVGEAPPGASPEADVEPSAVESREGTGASVRVSFSRIDQLVEMQAETLIFRNRLSDAVHQGMALLKQTGIDAASFQDRSTAVWEDVERAQHALEKVLNELQERVTNLGMVPLMGLFRSLRRLVHDESAREGKNVELVIEGGDTPIDKTLLEAAGEALGHLVRNAVIHGIELPAERLRRGKSEVGTVRLRATLEGGEIWIDVADDGAGVDVDALKARARQVLGDDVDTGSDLALLYAEGLSTHEGTDLSAGRGVGMAAVKKSVEGHGGRVDVRTQRGSGTSFSLRLPVTASILRSLLMTVDGEDYALPLSAVIETIRLTQADRHQVNRAGVTRWRGHLIPLLDLGLYFGTAAAPRDQGSGVVIEVDGRFRGLAIDAIVDIRDIVVKGLDSIVGQPVGISGSTILGDGRVVMILDPAALAHVPPFVEARK